jgi:hypothetical protein
MEEFLCPAIHVQFVFVRRGWKVIICSQVVDTEGNGDVLCFDDCGCSLSAVTIISLPLVVTKNKIHERTKEPIE